MKYITCFCVYEKEDKRAVDLALITAKQVFELFILILSGVVIGKIKMVNEEGKGMLSNLLIYFVVPFMIINSYMSGYNAEILKNMGRMLFYSILTICIGMALSIGITFLMKKEVRGIIRFATTFSNAAYMGFPLIQAMYGSEGVLYASVYVTVFNILSFKNYQRTITGLVYCHDSMGALPIGHYKIVGLQNVNMQEEDGFEITKYHFLVNENIDENILSTEEQNVLDAVINKFNSFKSQEIVEYMHEEIAYKKTNDKEIIPFSLARQIKDF